LAAIRRNGRHAIEVQACFNSFKFFRRLSQTTALSQAEQGRISTETATGMKSHAILSAAADVSRSIFFAAAIIIAAFLPLFTLSGVEGNIFGPMARTYASRRSR
jgi:heavy metal efflux system protein